MNMFKINRSVIQPVLAGLLLGFWSSLALAQEVAGTVLTFNRFWRCDC